jgi:hypothetical protein
MTEDLEGHLRRNALLWENWLSHGITEGMTFVVDFHFYATKEQIAQNLVTSLEAAGFIVEQTMTRTLIFLRGWEIEASEKSEWTLEYLNERTREFCRLADSSGFSFEGLGAEMP